MTIGNLRSETTSHQTKHLYRLIRLRLTGGASGGILIQWATIQLPRRMKLDTQLNCFVRGRKGMR